MLLAIDVGNTQTVFGLFDGDRLACTISMGLTSHRPGEDQGTLLRRADQAMYEAKRLGGDRVVLAAEPA